MFLCMLVRELRCPLHLFNAQIIKSFKPVYLYFGSVLTESARTELDEWNCSNLLAGTRASSLSSRFQYTRLCERNQWISEVDCVTMRQDNNLYPPTSLSSAT